MNQIATAAAWFSIFFEKALVKRVKRLMPVSAPSRLLDRRSVRLLKSERSTPHHEMKRIRIFYALSPLRSFWKRSTLLDRSRADSALLQGAEPHRTLCKPSRYTESFCEIRAFVRSIAYDSAPPASPNRYLFDAGTSAKALRVHDEQQSSCHVPQKIVFVKHFGRNRKPLCLRVQCPSVRGR